MDFNIIEVSINVSFKVGKLEIKKKIGQKQIVREIKK